MTQIQPLLPYIQIVLSIIMIALILMQSSSSNAGGAFGGDGFSGASHTKRGSEKIIFITTIIVGVLFAASAFVALLIK